MQMDERHWRRDGIPSRTHRVTRVPFMVDGLCRPNPSQTPLGDFGLTAAVSGQARSGLDMLDMLKGVIVREDDRLLPSRVRRRSRGGIISPASFPVLVR